MIRTRRFLASVTVAASSTVGGLIGCGQAYADPDPPPPPGVDAPGPASDQCWISRHVWVPCDVMVPAPPAPGSPGAVDTPPP